MDIIIKPGDYSYFSVSFSGKFDTSMLNAVRSVPGRIYKPDERKWLIPSDQNSVNLLLENLYKIELFNYVDNEKRIENDISNDIKKMKELLKTRHYSERTVDCYERWVKDFFEYYSGKENLGQNEINNYLTKLAVKNKISASTQNQALAALLFYFRFVKNDNPVNFQSVIRAKKNPRVPVVFSRTEVKTVISKMTGSKKLAAKLLYGTGLRLNELLNLRILDLDFDRHEIIVRYGKGSKDRHVMLPQSLIALLL